MGAVIGSERSFDEGPTRTVFLPMTRKPIPTWFFIVVIVRLEDRYLLVHENRPGHPWYLPAGRVEPGESLLRAAQRETQEETGVQIFLEGLLRIEHTARPNGSARLRVIFVARPQGDPTPKTRADEHSLRAEWLAWPQVENLNLRGDDVKEFLQYLEDGGKVYPLELISWEGGPLPTSLNDTVGRTSARARERAG